MATPIQLSRRTVAAGLALALLLPMAAAHARSPEIFTGIVAKTAVGGYDPVAYFTDAKPVRGSVKITHEWRGATWRFASEQNRALFKADPEKYAPQYGGHCAWAVSQGYTAKGDPQHWTVVNNKLYLNYNASVKRTWDKDKPGNIAKGDKNWPKVLEK
jgi:YHS domain-containing protein